MITYGLSLSKRRTALAAELESAGARTAEFDYRRRIVDDIEAILRGAEVFKPHTVGEPTPLDRYEENALLRRLAEDIAAYIVK